MHMRHSMHAPSAVFTLHPNLPSHAPVQVAAGAAVAGAAVGGLAAWAALNKTDEGPTVESLQLVSG